MGASWISVLLHVNYSIWQLALRKMPRLPGRHDRGFGFEMRATEALENYDLCTHLDVDKARKQIIEARRQNRKFLRDLTLFEDRSSKVHLVVKQELKK